MPRVVFWDVDTQVDFMLPEGKLYVPDSETIIPIVGRLTAYAHREGIPIVASADDHRPEHEELSNHPDFLTTFPPHCMHGTRGQTKVAESELEDPLVIEPDARDQMGEVIQHHRGDILLHKHRFDVFTNANIDAVLDTLSPEVLVVYGVALDVCVKHAIDGFLTRLPRTRILFVRDASRAIDQGQGEALMRRWRDRGVELITSTEILEGGILNRYLSRRTDAVRET